MLHRPLQESTWDLDSQLTISLFILFNLCDWHNPAETQNNSIIPVTTPILLTTILDRGNIMSIKHHWIDVFGLFILGVVGYFVWGIVYNLYFHPLHKFPGPLLARASNVCFSYWFHGGRQPYKILDLHLKYGPVVRIAPNDLSFNSAQSWQDIYGFRQGHKTFIKGIFYEGGVFSSRGVSSIDTERDPQRHANMRRLLANAFSMTSLTEQEELIRHDRSLHRRLQDQDDRTRRSLRRDQGIREDDVRHHR